MANISKSASKTLVAPASSSAKFTLIASFEETSIDNTNNRSTITVTATFSSSGYSFSTSQNKTLDIYWYDNNTNSDGRKVATTSFSSINANSSKTATGTITVTHKSDGSLKGYAKAVWTKTGTVSYVPPSGNVSTAETALKSIARTPSFTTNPVITATSETSITINRGATNISSNFSYSISPNAGTLSTSGSTATYSGLSANTAYTITITAANSNNTSLTTTKQVSTTTWAYPSLSSISSTTLTPGNSQTIYLNNPHGRSVTWYMRMNSTSSSTGTQVVTGTSTGTSVTFTPNIDTLFNSNGLSTNKTSINAFYYITYSNQTSSKPGTIAITESAYKPAWGSVTANQAIKYRDIDSTTVGITGDNQILVTGKSKLQYTKDSNYNATAVRSTISKYQISTNGSTYTDVTAGTYIPSGGTTVSTSASPVKIYLRAVDARGYTSDPLIKTISGNNLKIYTNPTGIITAQRENNYSETKIFLNIKPTWSVNSTNNKGTATYCYKVGTGTSGFPSTETSTTTFNSNIPVTGTFDNSKTYTFRVRLTDNFNGTSEYLYATVGPGVPIFMIDSATNSVGCQCFPRANSALDVDGQAYFSDDGVFINEKRLMQKFNMDLSSYNNTIFYPVVFDKTQDIIECEIHSPSYGGSEPYNQNIIAFEMNYNGWTDLPKTLNIKNYALFSNSEITIGCIGAGSKNGYNCIWLRGGLNYRFYSNIKPTFYQSSWSNGSGDNIETFTSGSNYYGGTNTNVDIIFTPQTTITEGSYSTRPIKAPSFDGNATSAYKLTQPSDSRPTSSNVNHEYVSNRATKRIDLVSSSMTTNKPDGEGWLETYFWDTDSAWDGQLFIPNSTSKRPSLRTRASASSWPAEWKQLAYYDDFNGSTWANISRSSGFNAGTLGTPQYKKVGNQVFIRGSWSTSNNIGTSSVTLGTLPSGFRPTYESRWIVSENGTGYIGRISVDTNGAIKLDWFGNTFGSRDTGSFTNIVTNFNFWID